MIPATLNTYIFLSVVLFAIGLLGVLVPALAAWVAYKRFIRRGISEAMAIWPPLPRTRETLKEDLEWVRNLRTRSAR